MHVFITAVTAGFGFGKIPFGLLTKSLLTIFLSFPLPTFSSPPCRAFSPVLKEFYKACADKGKLEIVYISSDKNLVQWQEYYGTMPWLSLPEGANESSSAIKNQLAQTMKIRGIPTMIVLEVKTGNFVTVTGREDVTQAGSDTTKGDEVIQAWKTMDAVPLEEADMGGGASGPTGIMAVIFYILKNPIYIFGLLYFYKQAVKYFNGGAAGGGPIEAEPEAQHDPSEF